MRSAELGPGVRYDLHQAFKIKLCANCHSGAIKDFESARFLAQLADPGFKGLVDREQLRFKLFAFADVVVGPAQHLRARAVLLFQLGPCRRASEAFHPVA